MKNISLKKLMLALLLTAAVPTLTAQVHVGDILCEGNAIVSPANYPSSGATAIGVVFYVDNTGQHGWAVALRNTGYYIWGGRGNDTPLPNYSNMRQAVYDLDGYENTRIVRSYGGSSSYPGFYAVDFSNGWYIPTIGQLNVLYGNSIEVNKGLVLVGGARMFSNGVTYWSSTEISAYDVYHIESTGELGHYFNNNSYCNKNSDTKRYIRAVRNF